MIINSITLKNFRSYENETTFSFTPTQGKNIVLIGGENGAGKSTLFEAIKLCIYGHTAYGYLGQNHNYLSKIKNNINDNAFKNSDIESSISITLSFNEGTNEKKYILNRSWKYKNQKLVENFSVYLNGCELNEDDKLYFDKYLKSVLPPSLFDFFFFDGEELSDFFTKKSSNSSLKEAILQLFNYDTFESLKRHLLSYQRTNSKSNAKLEEAQKMYDELASSVSSLKNEIENIKENIHKSEEDLDTLLIKKQQIDANFRNSGGIFEEERVSLNARISQLESERSDINQSIKDFCNEVFPFLLLTNLLSETNKQIKKEDALNSFNSIQTKLSSEVVKKSFEQYADLNDAMCNDIAETLLKNMFSNDDLDNIINILELSNEQKNSLSFTINNILNKKDIHKNYILNKFLRLKEIAESLKDLRETLNSTVSGEILNNYLESINIVNNEISEIENTIAVSKSTLDFKLNELSTKEYNLTKAKNQYTSLLQNNNVLEISKNLISYLDELLHNLTKDKIKLIEEEFINIFSKIIRKDNYVNSIVIDENFNSTLYINKEYTSTDVLNIITNIGIEGIPKKYGAKFLEDCYKYYNVTTASELENILRNNISFEYISLSTKVNINDFSNGEKQVYVLCLIWAIIKSSGVEIPFIIDTPYARIDDSHRNTLTNIYLPNISNQVIILSTNKEIDSKLHDVIKPYICNEYLLLYNTEKRKTEVKNGYFEV